MFCSKAKSANYEENIYFALCVVINEYDHGFKKNCVFDVSLGFLHIYFPSNARSTLDFPSGGLSPFVHISYFICLCDSFDSTFLLHRRRRKFSWCFINWRKTNLPKTERKIQKEESHPTSRPDWPLLNF